MKRSGSPTPATLFAFGFVSQGSGPPPEKKKPLVQKECKKLESIPEPAGSEEVEPWMEEEPTNMSYSASKLPSTSFSDLSPPFDIGEVCHFAERLTDAEK